jgi:hypothetical protein
MILTGELLPELKPITQALTIGVGVLASVGVVMVAGAILTMVGDGTAASILLVGD